ncbi:glycosyltransferase family protein [Saccharococcus caldoxylosilyticus]|uniref:hypothetical protein n=1 Tax=Saccharococcus caldoxylosilyticus TaxID=81408 RepID=UPI001C4DE2D2|nr:hypothetical protein [Parageobacillus caldoxylosilyticus]
MKILFMVTAPLETNSSASLRNLAVIRGLVELGHEVTIVSSQPIQSTNKVIDSIDKVKKYYLNYNRLYSVLTGTDSEQNKNKIIKAFLRKLRTIYHALFIFDHYRRVVPKLREIKLDSYYDIIITSSDPRSSHLLGKYLKKLGKVKYKKWIQYWGDPIYLDINNNLILPKFIVKWVEKRLLKEADAAVYVSPITCEMQKKIYYSMKDKLYFVNPPYLEQRIYNTFSKKHNIKIGYYGAYISSVRNIMPLYEAVKSMNNVHLDIVGNSDLSLESTDNIKVYSRESYHEIVKREAKTDILVCVFNRNGTQIPGKVYHYAATNKPVLLILDGDSEEMYSYLASFNRFVICHNNVHEIKNAINNIITGKISVLNEPLVECEPRIVAKRILDCVDVNGKEH